MALIELTADMTAQEQRETINANESYVERAGGWTAVNETLTYSAADAPSYTVTVPGDLTGTLYAGVKIKLTHAAATKYFIVTAASYSSPNTTLTLYGGTDYTLADTAISGVYYSTAKAPAGFPLDPAKWSVEAVSTSPESQATPTQNTVYTFGTLVVPIGSWRVGWYATAYPQRAAAGILDQECGLSSINTGFDTPKLNAACYVSNDFGILSTMHRETPLTITTKKTYYMLAQTSQTTNTSIGFYVTAAHGYKVLYAVCAYL